MNIRFTPIDFDPLDEAVRKMPMLPEDKAGAWIAALPEVQAAVLKFCSQKGLLALQFRNGVRHYDGAPGKTRAVNKVGRKHKITDGDIISKFPDTAVDHDYLTADYIHSTFNGQVCFRTIERRLSILFTNGKLECDLQSPPGYRR